MFETVAGALIILILIEAVVSWYLIGQFREHYLSGDEALTAALSDAGISRSAVLNTDIDLETERGQAWYVVTFSLSDAPGTVYRYRVDAETGAILSAQQD